MTAKHFLLLQGVATPFFNELGKAIKRNGNEVTKLNFCGGDLLFSRDLNSVNVNVALNELDQWFQSFLENKTITDAILFGDTRPIHQSILTVLRHASIRIHVYEEGYFRPHWVTLEKEGVNGFSSFQQFTLEQWQAHAEALPYTLKSKPVHVSLFSRAFYDLVYRFANGFFYPKFSQYQTHRPLNGLQEYLGWIKRFSTSKLWRSKQDKKSIEKLLLGKSVFYILPLQLESDAQIHTHSPFKTVGEVIAKVITSFAKHAPQDSLLVIKTILFPQGYLTMKKR